MSKPMRFIDEDPTTISEKKVSIISAPLAETVSWVGGTDQGPAALLKASLAVEALDDELLRETWQVGIDVREPLQLDGLSSEAALQQICTAVRQELRQGRFPVVLGGEHTVTVPAVAACASRFAGLHVVQIDAHLDLRDSYHGSSLSHACVMRRLADLGVPFTQVGIRSFSPGELEFLGPDLPGVFTTERIRRELDWVEQVCERITGPVYITLDVDGFDPAVMPATGTPEPDGLSWHQVASLFRALAARHRIVGMDVVELAPCPGAHHAVFTAAKILYRTLGYIFKDTPLRQNRE
jgi:agmatinase